MAEESETWCIAEFKDISRDGSGGNTVEAIPTKWLSRTDDMDYCKYPSTCRTESISKLIKNLSDPENDWVLYPIINIIKENVKDLAKAKEQIKEICNNNGYYTTASESEEAPHKYGTRRSEKAKQKFIAVEKTSSDEMEKDEEDSELVSNIGVPFLGKLKLIYYLPVYQL